MNRVMSHRLISHRTVALWWACGIVVTTLIRNFPFSFKSDELNRLFWPRGVVLQVPVPTHWMTDSKGFSH